MVGKGRISGAVMGELVVEWRKYKGVGDGVEGVNSGVKRWK